MTYGLVIASYKYGHLAAHAIETALAQTHKFDQIYFVDDGARDCLQLPGIYPEVLYTFRQHNMGTVANFQDMLMDKVQTDYVMFMGADNWLRQDALAQISEYKTDIVMYDILVVGDRQKEIHNRHPGETYDTPEGIYWTRQGAHHGSMMYHVRTAKHVGGYESPTKGRTLEDLMLYNKMIGYGATVHHIAQPFLYYRRHRENFNPC